MKSFKQYIISEAMNPVEIKPSEFPNPLKNPLKKVFQYKGKHDGDTTDDIVKVKPKQFDANKLKPTQQDVYLGKSLGMAINGVKGGDLGAVVSKDGHVLDGHHRWAATNLNVDPTKKPMNKPPPRLSTEAVKVGGVQADLNIGDLVPVMRGIGDSMGNKRRGAPEGNDKNIFQSDTSDAMNAIKHGKHMNPKFYNKDKAQQWLKGIGGKKELNRRLDWMRQKHPPAGSPSRVNMPVIDNDKGQVGQASGLLNRGDIDVRKPYAKIQKPIK